jgi:uracil-DNA glycosylase family 4
MAIGEAPGAEEDQAGTPFVGGSGRIFGRWLYECGSFRREIYVDNVYSHRPPGNELAKAHPNVAAAHEDLVRRIREVNPRVILALGDTALNFFGKSGIHNWRGSCFEWNGIKVVPTLHPAFISRVPNLWRFCVEDVKFALRKAEMWPTDKQVNYIIQPDHDTFDRWCKEIPDESEVSLDLETTMDFGLITQVNLSWRTREALVIDMEEEYIFPLLRLLKRPLKWVGQNIVMFDTLRLHEFGAPLLRVYADTMLAHHLLQSPAPHDLGFINSCYARYPYYKDTMQTARHLYAAKDADVTLQCWQMMKAELVAEGMWPLFLKVMRTAHHVRSMHLRGVPVDRGMLVEAKGELEQDAILQVRTLREASGNKFFNARSFQDCSNLLYKVLKLPPQYNRKGRERKVTTDDDALVKLGRIPAAKGIPQLILACRRPLNDLSKYVRPESVDPRGRWTVDWKIHGTETGRYSAWFHTLPPRIRHVVRQPGKNIAYVDAQQGEFRIATWCANDAVGKEVQERPGGVHNQNAVEIFTRIKGYKVKVEEVTPMMRFYAKFTTFGWIYGREAPSISEQYNIPLKEAQEIIDGLNKTYKRIVIWKAETASEALARGVLYNPYRRRRFFNEGSDSDKEREAYAFIPQSTLHDIVQECHCTVEEKFGHEVEVFADIHDALLLAVDPLFVPDELLKAINKEYLPGLMMPFDYDVHPFWFDKRAEEDAKGKVILQ